VKGVLLRIARNAGTNVGDKDTPLLTFRQVSDALGLASEQAAQSRYQRRVGNLNLSDSGLDGNRLTGAASGRSRAAQRGAGRTRSPVRPARPAIWVSCTASWRR
jgi:hypothetical protein